MPWLVKDRAAPETNLLFVHVPRCGGTSLVKRFDVERKSRAGRGCYHKCGLWYFFYRYRLLENANFPVVTYENLYAVLAVGTAFAIWALRPDWGVCRACPPPGSIYLWATGLLTFLMSTFVMNAQMGRHDWLRRFMMFVFGRVMCEFGSSFDYLHGVSYSGWLMHFTAERMLRHGLVQPRDMDDSFAIVRNPYSRFVSIYHYNRFGSCESFEHFTREWYAKWQRFREKGSTEDHDVYCHVLPMHAYTHHKGRQYVPNVIRQEDMRALGADGAIGSPLYKDHYAFLPAKVLAALRGLSTTNGRLSSGASGGKRWHEFYTQDTMDMVLEMYYEDFEAFGYDVAIEQRPDLEPKLSTQRWLSVFQSRPADWTSEGLAKGALDTAPGAPAADTLKRSFESTAFGELEDDTHMSLLMCEETFADQTGAAQNPQGPD